nr:hypothetical protein [Helicobacter pylori]
MIKLATIVFAICPIAVKPNNPVISDATTDSSIFTLNALFIL